MGEHEEPGGYAGEVTVRVDGEPARTARAALAARFEPVAGAVVWSGRIATAVAPRTELEIVTPHGTGRARATERDVWGGTRVRGTGRPPFPVDVLDVTDPDDTHPDDTGPDVAALPR